MASGGCSLIDFRTDDQRVYIRSELLRDDFGMVAYFEAKVGDIINFEVHLYRQETSSYTREWVLLRNILRLLFS